MKPSVGYIKTTDLVFKFTEAVEKALEQFKNYLFTFLFIFTAII